MILYQGKQRLPPLAREQRLELRGLGEYMVMIILGKIKVLSCALHSVSLFPSITMHCIVLLVVVK